MNAATVAAAIAAVHDVVNEGYDHVPHPGSAESPAVIVDRNGLTFTEDEYLVPVRAYVKASSHGGVADAQAVLDETLDRIEDRLADASVQTSGRIAYLAESDVWLAEIVVAVTRV